MSQEFGSCRRGGGLQYGVPSSKAVVGGDSGFLAVPDLLGLEARWAPHHLLVAAGPSLCVPSARIVGGRRGEPHEWGPPPLGEVSQGDRACHRAVQKGSNLFWRAGCENASECQRKEVDLRQPQF